MSLLLLLRSLADEVLATDAELRPLVGMRYSDDLGKTWSHWRFRTLGKAGRYLDKARWNALGSIKPPGRMFQFKATDATIRRFSKVLMNVPPE